LAVHKKERDRPALKRHLCSSPVYDPNDEGEAYRIARPAALNFEPVDEGREF